jgi:hypothetical protein
VGSEIAVFQVHQTHQHVPPPPLFRLLPSHLDVHVHLLQDSIHVRYEIGQPVSCQSMCRPEGVVDLWRGISRMRDAWEGRRRHALRQADAARLYISSATSSRMVRRERKDWIYTLCRSVGRTIFALSWATKDLPVVEEGGGLYNRGTRSTRSNDFFRICFRDKGPPSGDSIHLVSQSSQSACHPDSWETVTNTESSREHATV